MEVKVFTCPWCGAELEKGTFGGARYAFMKDGEEIPYPNPFKPLIENESGIYIHNWSGKPVAYACRQCRKIILPY